MEDKNNKKVYSPIEDGQLLDIWVILDGNIVKVIRSWSNEQ